MKRYLLWINGIALFSILAYFAAISVIHSGTYVYPLDDTYIHLSIAKHFAVDGVWGITPEHFSSTTSSPLYTATQALCIGLFGVGTYYPILLNVLLGIGMLYVLHRYLKNQPAGVYAIAMGSVIWFTPMYVQILSGMEHVMHMLFMLLFMFSASKAIQQREVSFPPVMVLALAFLSTAVRYESLFIILPVGLWFLLNRQWKKALLTIFAGILPVLLYGTYSVYQGSHFIPNSLLIKGNMRLWDMNLYYLRFKDCVINHPHVPALFVLLLVALMVQEKYKAADAPPFVLRNFMPLTLLVGILLHALFAGFGWLFRYEAYLIVLAIVALVPLLAHFVRPWKQWRWTHGLSLVLLLCASSLFGYRFYKSLHIMQRASINIYEQQHQMARFLKKYYDGQTVVANDIGAITYYADIHLVDIVGLGSREVVDIKRNTSNNLSEFSLQLSSLIDKKQAPVMVIYQDWFSEIPERYTKVAEWKITDNRVCGNDVVSFYATTPGHEPVLRNQLADFKQHLHPNVEVIFMD